MTTRRPPDSFWHADAVAALTLLFALLTVWLAGTYLLPFIMESTP